MFARALWPTDRWIGPVAAAVSLLPAWLSFRFVEDPIRFNPRLRGRRVLMLAALSIAVPVAACGGLVGAHAAFERTAALRSWNRVERPHVLERVVIDKDTMPVLLCSGAISGQGRILPSHQCSGACHLQQIVIILGDVPDG